MKMFTVITFVSIVVTTIAEIEMLEKLKASIDKYDAHCETLIETYNKLCGWNNKRSQ